MSAKRDEEKRRAQLRRALWFRSLLLLGVLIALLIILSLPFVQEHWLPIWITSNWSRIVAGAIMVLVGMGISFPVVIEANVNTRVLSGPGRTPPGATIGGKPPLGG